MVTIVGVLLGLVLLYVWVLGYWFAAVVAMPIVGLALTELVLSKVFDRPSMPVAWAMTIAVSLLAWIPWLVRRALTRQPPTPAPVITPAPQSLPNISLIGRDASFNG